MLATLPAGFVETTVADGVSGGTAMEFAPNGDLWALEQTGAVKRYRPNNITADVVGNVSTLGLSSFGERGLLGIAFDPEYTSNKLVYLYYTATAPNTHNRISRFTVNDTDATDYYFAGASTVPTDAGSSGTPTQQILFELDTLGATNHNGGAIHFGPDGKLYIAVGDNAIGNNAQSLNTVHGKMLRLNSDGTIPSDNPFFSVTSGNNRAVWALGLRNPFTFAFQPDTGRMFINDVGQNTTEEINEGIPGANYGWPSVEGNQGTPPTNPGSYKAPLYVYSHGGGPLQGFAITGGAFYNPAVQQFPSEYVGRYFYADFVNSWINVLDVTTGTATPFATNAPGTVDLRVGSDGGLYYLARNSGRVFRVTALSNVTITLVEDSSAGVTLSNMGLTGETITYTIVNAPAQGTLSGQAPNLTYTPSANYSGSDVFTYRASDGQISSALATVSLTVSPVNDVPSFLAGPDQQATDENETLQISGWATAISAGPANEASQQLQFVIQTNSNPSIFANPPSIDATGALTFTPAPNTSGVATLTVAIQDNGGTAANGTDRSPTQTFRIRIEKPHIWHNAANPVNVNADSEVVADDALAIINYINSTGSGPVPAGALLGPPYYDVSADNYIAANDVLAVINFINAQLEGQAGEANTPTDSLLELLAADLATQPKRRK